jgi:hypothetical protein
MPGISHLLTPGHGFESDGTGPEDAQSIRQWTRPLNSTIQSRNNDGGGVTVVVAPGRSGPQFLISDPVSDLTLAIKEPGM